jgi:hypothetical protein
MLRVALPMLYLLISLIILLIDKSEDPEDGNDSLFDRDNAIPSVNQGAKETGDQIAILVFILVELVRQTIIFVVGIILYCNDFGVRLTKIYFWSRTINSGINIISHLVLFFVLKANSLLLIVALVVFFFDGFF